MFLINIIYWFKRIFEISDYYVNMVYINYTADMIMEHDEIENISELWKDESYSWTDLKCRYHWDITQKFHESKGNILSDLLLSLPRNVRDVVYTVKYYYNNKIYKYVSNSDIFCWPPKHESISFNFPIMEAWCLTEDGKKIRNVTSKIKKAAGPSGNFHNQDVKIMDIVDYDYPKVEVTTLLKTKIIDENDSVLEI